jgi:hypothetical protein
LRRASAKRVNHVLGSNPRLGRALQLGVDKGYVEARVVRQQRRFAVGQTPPGCRQAVTRHQACSISFNDPKVVAALSDFHRLAQTPFDLLVRQYQPTIFGRELQ